MTISLSIGPQNRKSPFFKSTLQDGLTSASVYNHMYFPTSYGDKSAEYDRLLKGVAMWDVSIERQVAFRGRDAVKFAPKNTARESIEYPSGVVFPLLTSTYTNVQALCKQNAELPRQEPL